MKVSEDNIHLTNKIFSLIMKYNKDKKAVITLITYYKNKVYFYRKPHSIYLLGRILLSYDNSIYFKHHYHYNILKHAVDDLFKVLNNLYYF